ncbi:hypothetical protein P691DRAFT_759930 [Macrolepiota fuliginosa MF-IS2]|uniref:Nephrocystin 3-like N-terminal domain-containing protein n=1 Tax=Macrolepiota fuliginosa MF-IS2 TaxID=1400762 RepID=A0A9P5XDP7_9AGAR|nr:hypothetical protein P691DRAFT_759930 [Macrolepiota fuliginosa MF-IS2]
MPDAGILPGAHDFTLNYPVFNDNSAHLENPTIHNAIIEQKSEQKRLGLERLLKASMPDAFHDSSARNDPPSCHPGTRHDFIDTIVGWGLGVTEHTERLLWLHGPAGVGKSAVAQTCAELIGEKNMLGAALFFSRPNERDDPHRLFPSLSYQIATKSKSYGDILDHRIRNDPTLVMKSVREQFQELLVKPLSQLGANVGGDVEGLVIIIDGLDECDKGPQVHCEIIEIIATSIRHRTTPFRWAFFSRSETHIVGSFTADNLPSLSYQLEVPVSRKIDNQIALYLTAELRKIQQRSGLPDSWLSERDIGMLVKLSAGLFIYAATLIRFVGNHKSLGPVDQLRAVLALGRLNRKAISLQPLSELDHFYILIMQSIPSEVLPRVQAILLLLTHVRSWRPRVIHTGNPIPYIANTLGISESQFRNACSALHSVLELDPKGDIKFHHTSFMDFLLDSRRSGDFCVYSRLHSLRFELSQRLTDVHARSRDFVGEPPAIEVTLPHPRFNRSLVYRRLVDVFFGLCQWDGHPLDLLTSEALCNFAFHMIPLLEPDKWFFNWQLSPTRLKKNIPTNFHDRILRRIYNPVIYYLLKSKGGRWSDLYVLGRGKNRVLHWRDNMGKTYLSPYPTWCNFS